MSFENLTNRSNSELSNNLYDLYVESLGDFSELAKRYGYPLEPFARHGKSRFLGFSKERQAAVLNGLWLQLASYNDCIENNLDIGRGGSKIAWWAIRDLKLRPLSDLFSSISDNDVIEIYDANHVQIFRSFNFLQGVSYSLDELLTYEWWELYLRDHEVTSNMVETVTHMLRSDSHQTIARPFPRHYLSERFSIRKKRAEIESRLLSPLFDTYGRMAGYVNTFHLISVVDQFH